MKRNLFDNMTEIPKTVKINDKTVFEDSGINKSRIKSEVFEQLGLKKPKRNKRLIKRMAVAAAVAVLTVGVMNLPVVAENLYAAYGSVIGGYSYAAELENAKDAEIKISDPNLQVDSVQVGGDENGNSIIEITLSKKNGGKFIDDTFNVVKESRFYARFSSMGDDFDSKMEKDLELIINDSDERSESQTHEIKDSYTSNKGLGYKARYGVENGGKNLKILIVLNVESRDGSGEIFFGKNIKGKKIDIKSYSYCAASVDDVIEKFDNLDEENYNKVMKLQKENREGFPYDLLTNSFYYSDVMYNDSGFELVKGRGKSFYLPFEISFVFDYDTETEEIAVDDKTLENIFGNKETNGRMSISPFGFFLLAKNDGSHDGESIRFEEEKCYVLMKDGTKYYLQADGCSYDYKNTVFKCNYSKFPNNKMENHYTNMMYVVDKEQIDKIVVNGVEVY